MGDDMSTTPKIGIVICHKCKKTLAIIDMPIPLENFKHIAAIYPNDSFCTDKLPEDLGWCQCHRRPIHA
jgi:hypothetical protein